MLVVDASVVFKWFDEKESQYEQALKLLDDYILKKEILAAPDILVYELANAWATKTEITKQIAKQNLQKFQKINIKLRVYDFDFLQKVMIFVKKYHVAIYAASYAVLAKEKGCDLITADSKFVTQVKLPFVKNLTSYS